MKLHKLIIFLFLLSLYACKSSTKEVETVSMDDLIPQSSRSENVEEEVVEEEAELSKLAQSLIDYFDSVELLEDSIEQQFFPDRLSYIERTSIAFNNDDKKIAIISWEFSDSTQTLSAFYNWLDCFGEKCESLRIGEEKRIKGLKTAMIWVGRRNLIYLKSDDFVNYSSLNKFIESIYDEEWLFHFIQQKHKEVEWFIPLEEEGG